MALIDITPTVTSGTDFLPNIYFRNSRKEPYETDYIVDVGQFVEGTVMSYNLTEGGSYTNYQCGHAHLRLEDGEIYNLNITTVQQKRVFSALQAALQEKTNPEVEYTDIHGVWVVLTYNGEATTKEGNKYMKFSIQHDPEKYDPEVAAKRNLTEVL